MSRWTVRWYTKKLYFKEPLTPIKPIFFILKIVVKLLVENGGNLNALTITQATPFMRAIESASYKVVEYLLEQGAKITQENIVGKTAFDLARDFADPRVYYAVKNKFDLLPKPKDGAKPKPKKKPEKKKPKKGEVEVSKKIVFHYLGHF